MLRGGPLIKKRKADDANDKQMLNKTESLKKPREEGKGVKSKAAGKGIKFVGGQKNDGEEVDDEEDDSGGDEEEAGKKASANDAKLAEFHALTDRSVKIRLTKHLGQDWKKDEALMESEHLRLDKLLKLEKLIPDDGV